MNMETDFHTYTLKIFVQQQQRTFLFMYTFTTCYFYGYLDSF